jgi:hypothetical protein
MIPSTLRTSACAQTAPNRPTEAPITATGLPRRRVVGERTGGPVARVLQLPGD